MPTLDDICQGLAANLAALRGSDVVGQVSAYLLDNPTPPSVMVAGVAPGGVEYVTYYGGSVDPGMSWQIAVEVAFGKATDLAGQKRRNALLAPTGNTSLVVAAESDPTLTSRLEDDGTITTGQPAAAQALSFQSYAGQQRFVFPNGNEYLLGTWIFQVVS